MHPLCLGYILRNYYKCAVEFTRRRSNDDIRGVFITAPSKRLLRRFLAGEKKTRIHKHTIYYYIIR